jgi:hypothetical protein
MISNNMLTTSEGMILDELSIMTIADHMGVCDRVALDSF